MKKLMIFGGLALGLGQALLLAVYLMVGGDLSRIEDRQYQSHHKEFSADSLKNLSLDLATADLEIVGSDRDKVVIDYTESNKEPYIISNSGGTLSIEEKGQGRVITLWFNFDGFFELFEKDREKVRVELPKDLLTEMTAEVDLGEVSLSNLSIKGSSRIDANLGDLSLDQVDVVDDLEIDADSGNVNLTDVKAKSLTLINDLGDIQLDRLEVDGDADLKLSSGQAEIEDMNAASLSVKNSLGDVHLTDATVDNGLEVQVSSGDIQFTNLLVGKELSFTNDLGDITGDLADEMSNYSIVSEVDLGDNNLPPELKAGPKKLEVHASSGNVDVAFKP